MRYLGGEPGSLIEIIMVINHCLIVTLSDQCNLNWLVDVWYVISLDSSYELAVGEEVMNSKYLHQLVSGQIFFAELNIR